jgi:hypothetical protein
MFGGTSHPPPTTSTDSEPERKNEEVDNKKDLVSSLLSETVSDLHTTTTDMDTHSKCGVIEIIIVFGFRCGPSKKDLGVTGFVKHRACTLKATLLIEKPAKCHVNIVAQHSIL